MIKWKSERIWRNSEWIMFALVERVWKCFRAIFIANWELKGGREASRFSSRKNGEHTTTTLKWKVELLSLSQGANKKFLTSGGVILAVFCLCHTAAVTFLFLRDCKIFFCVFSCQLEYFAPIFTVFLSTLHEPRRSVLMFLHGTLFLLLLRKTPSRAWSFLVENEKLIN